MGQDVVVERFKLRLLEVGHRFKSLEIQIKIMSKMRIIFTLCIPSPTKKVKSLLIDLQIMKI